MTLEEITEAMERIDNAICDRCNSIDYHRSSRLSRVRDCLDQAKEYLSSWDAAS